MWDYRVVCLHIDSLGVMTVVMEHSAPTFYHGDHYQVAAELDTGDSALCFAYYCPYAHATIIFV